jgi:hypothetical protein
MSKDGTDAVKASLIGNVKDIDVGLLVVAQLPVLGNPMNGLLLDETDVGPSCLLQAML